MTEKSKLSFALYIKIHRGISFSVDFFFRFRFRFVCVFVFYRMHFRFYLGCFSFFRLRYNTRTTANRRYPFLADRHAFF